MQCLKNLTGVVAKSLLFALSVGLLFFLTSCELTFRDADVLPHEIRPQTETEPVPDAPKHDFSPPETEETPAEPETVACDHAACGLAAALSNNERTTRKASLKLERSLRNGPSRTGEEQRSNAEKIALEARMKRGQIEFLDTIMREVEAVRKP